MGKLRLKEVREAQRHTAGKWQDCKLMAAPSGCKAPVSCLDHTDHGYYVKTLTLRFPYTGQRSKSFYSNY